MRAKRLRSIIVSNHAVTCIRRIRFDYLIADILREERKAQTGKACWSSRDEEHLKTENVIVPQTPAECDGRSKICKLKRVELFTNI